jgi:hypothetical protein
MDARDDGCDLLHRREHVRVVELVQMDHRRAQLASLAESLLGRDPLVE